MKLPKETSLRSGELRAGQRHGRWYDDACGTAFALELIGERWSLLIVRELMFGPRRFTDLRGALPGISAKVLSERLDGLEAAAILTRRQLPPPAPAQVYELTAWGYGAEEAIKALGRWAASSPAHDPALPLSPASFMLSLRTMFDPAIVPAGLAVTGAIAIGGDRFSIAVADRSFVAARGEAEQPEFVMAAPTATPIAAATYQKVPFAQLADQGLTVAGEAAAARFVALFHLPDKVG